MKHGRSGDVDKLNTARNAGIAIFLISIQTVILTQAEQNAYGNPAVCIIDETGQMYGMISEVQLECSFMYRFTFCAVCIHFPTVYEIEIELARRI